MPEPGWPEFRAMTQDQKRAYLAHIRAEAKRIALIVRAQVACPYCNAQPGERCRQLIHANVRKIASYHKARYDAWKDSGKPGL